MSVLTNMKCKACGAPIDYDKAVGGVIKCEYCLEYNTVPKRETEPEALALIRSAASLLYSCDFEKAYDAYFRASQIDAGEPEAYFGMALAEYKVQYIKDELSGKYQPICHELWDRTFEENKNYLKALELSTPEQREQYEFKAREIDEVRHAFYTIKSSGLQYDCFICSKVSEDGKKTEDSARANDIYYYLKDKGFKPFFSERELNNRSGVDYEALILYALNDSKCMIVVCSDEKYLLTPWVKNEYTRFLRMINEEEKASDGITIVYNGAPIERLPGKKGKIQGINAGGMDAMSKVEEFVRSHTAEKKKAEVKYCIECGAECAIDVRFCPVCGKTDFAASEENARLIRAERAEKSREEVRRLTEEAEKAKAEKESAERAKAEKDKADGAATGFFAKLKSVAADVVRGVESAAEEVGAAIDSAFDGADKPEKPAKATAKATAADGKSSPEGSFSAASKDGKSSPLITPDFTYSDGGKVHLSSLSDGRIGNDLELMSDGCHRVLTKYNGSGGDVVIPKGIFAIGEHAFSGCKKLKSVVIPEGVIVIGANAFSGCSALKSVTFPKGLGRIGEYAFCDCKSLESIVLPSSVNRIEAKAFAGCAKIKKLTLSTKLGYIGEYAFYGCSSIVGVGFPHNSMSIDNCAFSDCVSLKSAVITREVHTVGENVFFGCESMSAFCEAPKCPKDWNKDWNVVKKSGISKLRCRVTWGYTK